MNDRRVDLPESEYLRLVNRASERTSLLVGWGFICGAVGFALATLMFVAWGFVR